MQSTSAQRARRAHSQAQPSAAPFSRTAAKLIEQIQADARATLLEELSAKDAIVVLHPVDHESKLVRFHLDGHLTIRDQRGTVIYLSQRREEPECWRNSSCMAGKWHPSHWHGHQILIDAAGREWMNSFEDFVIDDFGTLVEVPA